MKKGKGERAEKYRGVILLPTLYKVYIVVLTERLREEVERKVAIQECQGQRFRKEMGTIDNIYAMNHLMERQLEKRGEVSDPVRGFESCFRFSG